MHMVMLGARSRLHFILCIRSCKLGLSVETFRPSLLLTWSLSFQVMICRLLGVKSRPKVMLTSCQSDLWKQTLSSFGFVMIDLKTNVIVNCTRNCMQGMIRGVIKPFTAGTIIHIHTKLLSCKCSYLPWSRMSCVNKKDPGIILACNY